MTPAQLSRDLRYSNSPNLRRRRGLLCLSLAAAGTMGFLSLYQMGIIRRIPEPPLPGMNAEAVDGSPQAYSYLSTPDAVLGLHSYTATAVLAAMGASDRATRRPWIPALMGAKVLVDVLAAAKLTWDQWARHKAFCFWCLTAAATTFAMIPLALPETMQALRRIRETRRTPRPLFKRTAREMAGVR